MRLSVVVVLPLLAACAVGPSYRRPAVPTPETTRGERGPGAAASLADSPWWAIFRDPALQALVEEALRGSHDLRAAAARVEQARNQIAIARADMFPQVSYQGEAVRERAFAPGLPANVTLNSFLATFNLAWEIDLWGRIRRATEAARADYLAAEAVRRGVLLTLVSDVAQAYFELLELDRELEITHSTTATFQDTADLFQRRPDIQEAEQALIAANAEVGVAVANFFPRVGLTSLYGGQSTELENVVKSAANVWAVGGSVAGPLFQGERLLASYRVSSAAWD